LPELKADNADSRPFVPTMNDVARKAGVSTMTVSRALKNGALVAESTRERIMNAVEELGYVLDQSAGSLSSKRTGFVAVLIPSINNSNFAETAHGLTQALEHSGLQILLGYTDYSIQHEEKLIESMLRRRPEGIVVTGGKHTPRARRFLETRAFLLLRYGICLQCPCAMLLVFQCGCRRKSRELFV